MSPPLLLSTPLVLAEFSVLQRLSGLFPSYNSLFASCSSTFCLPGRTSSIPLGIFLGICFLELSPPLLPSYKNLCLWLTQPLLKNGSRGVGRFKGGGFREEHPVCTLSLRVACGVAQLRHRGLAAGGCCRAQVPCSQVSLGSSLVPLSGPGEDRRQSRLFSEALGLLLRPPLPGLLVPKILDIWERGQAKYFLQASAESASPALSQIPKLACGKTSVPCRAEGHRSLRERVTGMLLVYCH